MFEDAYFTAKLIYTLRYAVLKRDYLLIRDSKENINLRTRQPGLPCVRHVNRRDKRLPLLSKRHHFLSVFNVLKEGGYTGTTY